MSQEWRRDEGRGGGWKNKGSKLGIHSSITRDRLQLDSKEEEKRGILFFLILTDIFQNRPTWHILKRQTDAQRESTLSSNAACCCSNFYLSDRSRDSVLIFSLTHLPAFLLCFRFFIRIGSCNFSPTHTHTDKERENGTQRHTEESARVNRTVLSYFRYTRSTLFPTGTFCTFHHEKRENSTPRGYT